MNNSYYVPGDDKINEDDFTSLEFFVELTDSEKFNIGQCYEDEGATMIACKECGSTDFKVGVGSYFTAIRCPNCKWEECIHEG